MELQGDRRTAVKLFVRDILDGVFFREEGWSPNYLDTLSGVRVYRVNIVGVVVAVILEEGALYIDDGSGSVLVRNYTDRVLSFRAGDFCLVIGRVRESGSQRYVSLEISRKVHPSWVAFRRLELERARSSISSVVGINLGSVNGGQLAVDSTQETINHEPETVNREPETDFSRIVSFLQGNDSGGGVSVEAVLAIGVSESSLQDLLRNGTIYQNRPGYVRLIG